MGQCCSSEQFYGEAAGNFTLSTPRAPARNRGIGKLGSSETLDTEVHPKAQAHLVRQTTRELVGGRALPGIDNTGHTGDDDESASESSDADDIFTTQEHEHHHHTHLLEPKEPGTRRSLVLLPDGVFQMVVEHVQTDGPHENLDFVVWNGTYVSKRKYEKMKAAEDPCTLTFETIKMQGRSYHRNTAVDATPTKYSWFTLREGKGREHESMNPLSLLQAKKRATVVDCYPYERELAPYNMHEPPERRVAQNADVRGCPAMAGHGSPLDIQWACQVPSDVFDFEAERLGPNIEFEHVEPITCVTSNTDRYSDNDPLHLVKATFMKHSVSMEIGPVQGEPLTRIPKDKERGCQISGF